MGQTCASVASDPAWSQYGAHIGVVGCTRVGLTYDVEDYERDYAETISQEIVKLMQCLCTSPGDTLNTNSFDTVLGKMVGIVVAGALLKTARYMKAGGFRNIVIIQMSSVNI